MKNIIISNLKYQFIFLKLIIHLKHGTTTMIPLPHGYQYV
jgi:hypothetical protein